MMEIKNKRLQARLTKEELQYLVSEQAQSVSKVLNICMDNGKPFIEHFHKVIQDIKNNDTKNYMHHCREMQGWWRKVSTQRYKHNKKVITDEDLVDSFFTVGGISEDYLPIDEVKIYEEKFIPTLLLDREQKISDVFDKIKGEIVNGR